MGSRLSRVFAGRNLSSRMWRVLGVVRSILVWPNSTSTRTISPRSTDIPTAIQFPRTEQEGSFSITLSLRHGEISHDPSIRVIPIYDPDSQSLRLEIQLKPDSVIGTSDNTAQSTRQNFKQAVVCAILGELHHPASSLLGQLMSSTDADFACLRLKTLENGQEHYIKCCMDTAADENVMSETTAIGLSLDYVGTAGGALKTLIGLGNQKADIVGYVPVKLRPYCKTEYIEEWFYILRDQDMAGTPDALLSCALTCKLGHMVRIKCPACDS